jgi:hypothetical protein
VTLPQRLMRCHGIEAFVAARATEPPAGAEGA